MSTTTKKPRKRKPIEHDWNPMNANSDDARLVLECIAACRDEHDFQHDESSEFYQFYGWPIRQIVPYIIRVRRMAPWLDPATAQHVAVLYYGNTVENDIVDSLVVEYLRMLNAGGDPAIEWVEPNTIAVVSASTREGQ